ncbi:hypothetical protein GALL_534930 [mine drainage metagenome]|uniref:Uncharacterized protein n=1 Tax=mine drainage metagenome TaxID=410659 RepID=A0A1J5P083_9ZZZZ
MAAQRAQWVIAEQPCTHVHPGKAKALRNEARDLIVAELVEDGQRFEMPRLSQQGIEAPLVIGRDRHDGLERIDRVLQLALHLGGGDFQGVRGEIVRQDDAVAVEDQSALRRDGNEGDAVVERLGGKLPMPQDLQPDPAPDQQCKAQHHHAGGKDQPAAKAEQLAFDIAQFGHRAGGSNQ